MHTLFGPGKIWLTLCLSVMPRLQQGITENLLTTGDEPTNDPAQLHCQHLYLKPDDLLCIKHHLYFMFYAVLTTGWICFVLNQMIGSE